jgi:adenosylcobyric acid synthase
MIQATGSHAGKSTLVAGLGRLFARRGLTVRPFKPQNMSNNAAVTADGGEIGRAQALQARACFAAPSRHMNPVLLKPESETGAQLVMQGRVVGHYGARAFGDLKPTLLPAVLESFVAVSDGADLVLVEGAGSPAEVNLRAGDIANMGFALAADVPVVLIGDIDRGGVIAALIGTWQLLEPPERALLRGYVVNKFRGDPTLFDDAHAVICAHTGLPSLGVVPWCAAAGRLPAEDVLGLEERSAARVGDQPIRIVVPRLSRSANFDDLDPLRAEPDVELVVVPPGRALPGDADLVLLTGSKSTIADLAFLRAQGWDIDVQAHVRRGGHVMGLCGGYQMLGRRVADPAGVEGPAGETAGLGLLDVVTELAAEKTVREATGVELASRQPVHGYEIHLGVTTGPDTMRPMLHLEGRDDGATSTDGRVTGCYLHGLFAADAFRHLFLARLRPRADSGLHHEVAVDAALDALADHLAGCLDIEQLQRLAAERCAR